MLGTVIGDIVGSARARRSSRHVSARLLVPADARFSDHTVCTAGVADALLGGGDPTRAFQRWCRERPAGDGRSRAFAAWVAADTPRPLGRHDAAGAVRVSPAGLLGQTLEDALGRALRVTAITHDHPEGIRAALAVAAAIRWAREGLTADALRASITMHFAYDLTTRVDRPPPGGRRPAGIATVVAPAIACALDASDFEGALRAAVAVAAGEPVAAIAGGIAEARFGIPPDIARAGWSRLPADIADVFVRLYDAARCPLPGR